MNETFALLLSYSTFRSRISHEIVFRLSDVSGRAKKNSQSLILAIVHDRRVALLSENVGRVAVVVVVIVALAVVGCVIVDGGVARSSSISRHSLG